MRNTEWQKQQWGLLASKPTQVRRWFLLHRMWCREARYILMHWNRTLMTKVNTLAWEQKSQLICVFSHPWPSSPFRFGKEFNSNVMWILDKILHSSVSDWWAFCHPTAWTAYDFPAFVPFAPCPAAVRPKDLGKDGWAGVNKRDASWKGKQCPCLLQSLGALSE